MKPLIGIIGGSGLSEIDGLTVFRELELSTPYGPPSAAYIEGSLCGEDVVFLARHGTPHAIPPHKVNYRANIWGFRSLGVRRIVSVSAVGGISAEMEPGAIVLVDQIIDVTAGARESTFYDDRAVHIDFTEPYCPELRSVALKAAASLGLPAKQSGTYVCVNGPRLETAAEIRSFAAMGADVVGMTAMPEASLAREAELCLLGISVVANCAAGLARGKLTAVEVVETMRSATDRIKALIREIILHTPHEHSCLCGEALKDAVL